MLKRRPIFLWDVSHTRVHQRNLDRAIFQAPTSHEIFVVGLGALTVVVFFVVDTIQTKYAVRRNYPVIGRLRHVFERYGKFFRQYFFAMDREEMPFNREQREWVYRAAKNTDNTVAFGSTRDLHPTGTVLFVNCPFPTLEEDMRPTTPVTIGPYCTHP